MDFVFAGLPTRVIFGAGRMGDLGAEAQRLGMKRPLVITGRQQSEIGVRAAETFGHAVHFGGAAMHTPVDVTTRAMALVKAEGIDGTIAIGGGSAIGLGKAIAFRTDFPQIAVPTTYAGSEMTNILGETAEGAKTTKRDAKIQPETVIYDPDLTTTLPASLAVTSGLNAIAHAVEALYARDGNPVISLMAEDGIRALAVALRDPKSKAADALYGAWLCGAVLGSVSMALHHKLCHVLGGSFNMPHSETHAVILPHAMAYNAPLTAGAMTRVARAIGAPSAPRGLHDLARHLKSPMSLWELGFKRENLEKAADIAVANPYWNPRDITREGILQLLQNAYDGVRPEA